MILAVCPVCFDSFTVPKWSIGLLWAAYILFNWSAWTDSSRTIPSLLIPAGVFLLAACLSLPGSPNVSEGLIALCAAVLFFLWIRSALSLGAIETNRIDWARSITYSAALVSLIAFCQITGLWLDSQSPFNPSTSFGHRNLTAEYLIISIPISLYLAHQRRRTRESTAILIIILIELLALILISCRSSWVALVTAGILCGLVLMRAPVRASRRWWGGIITISLCFTLVLLANPSTRDRLASILEPGHGTNRFRILVWRSAFEMMEEHPIRGIGLGNFQILYPLYRSGEEIRISGPDVYVSHAHNEYIEFALETGPLGLIGVLWLIVVFYRQIVRNMGTGGNFAAFSLAACGSVTAVLTNSLFASTLHNPVPLFLSAFLIGAVFSKPRESDTAPARIPPSTIWSFRAAALVLVLFGSWMALYTGYLSIGIRVEHAGDPEAASVWYRKAARIWPADRFASYRRIYTLLQLNRNSDAATEGRRLLERHPHFQNGWYNLGIALDRMGAFHDAQSAYDQSLKLNPFHARSWNNTGILKQRSGNGSEAASAFSKALECDPRLFDAYHNLVIVYAGQNRFGEARELLEKALENSRSIFFNRSMTQHMSILGRMKVRAAAVMPGGQTPWSSWVTIEFFARSDIPPQISNPTDEIRIEWDAKSRSMVVRMNFVNPAIKYLGEYQLRGKTERFEIDLRRPDIANLWNDYGVVMEHEGNTSSAWEAWRHAALLDGKNPDIRANVDRIRSGLGTPRREQ